MERKQLALQPRLHMLARLVPEGCRLTDVGTDHGYLPVVLLQQGRITAAIASDIGAEPLEHARRTAQQYGVKGIDFRLCSGLSAIAPEETDVIVIAGMGGENIAQILAGAPWTADGRHTLLLQPQSRAEALRRFILDDLHSGATVYESYGAYNMQKRREIITIVDKAEYQKLMSYMNREDPQAFITVYTVSDMRYQPKGNTA